MNPNISPASGKLNHSATLPRLLAAITMLGFLLLETVNWLPCQSIVLFRFGNEPDPTST